ncbi:hypothetical protein Mesil_1340 [Allomeiothermus silvanus DSM 9946]|uniref:Uncharacterized protein n=1 Tax=Allomeiothermus silvanus (strain ATCC 700542 / DSM 9946 / NBRC 106475 / NCIMB 13440 / VI-R2) TaxID=526227 RepID=D7BEJ0_ALLS1|nr:hypothetical protein Mesil_1340 [Allomeiothermus silvanus DSM 9946]
MTKKLIARVFGLISSLIALGLAAGATAEWH